MNAPRWPLDWERAIALLPITPVIPDAWKPDAGQKKVPSAATEGGKDGRMHEHSSTSGTEVPS